MKKIYGLILIGSLLVIAVLTWFWWQKPQTVEMAQFAPADALIYLETNDLPKILESLTKTEAWQNHAEEFGLAKQTNFGWLSKTFAQFGIGSAETNLLGRAQIAVVLLGFEATEVEQNLQLKPRAVIIAETHLSESGAKTAIESLVGDFVGKNFREAKISQTEAEGAKWIIWTDSAANRKIFAAILENTVFIGNDEQSVKTCLAVRRGERESLKNDSALAEMRRKLSEKDTLAFGYVTTSGVKQLSEISTAAFAGKITESQTAMSLIAQSLPPLVQKTVNSVGWTTKLENGKLVDRYVVAMPDDFVSALREPLATSIESNGDALQFLPRETKSLTRYNLQKADKAWNGLIFALTTKLDTISAVFVGQFSKAILAPYGIIEPNVFLGAVGTEIITAQISADDENSLTIFRVRDEQMLKTQVLQRLQTNAPKEEKIGNAILWTSENDFAAAFADGFLLTGTPEIVRKSLEARQKSAVLAKIEERRKFLRESPAVAVNFADETEKIQTFLQIVHGKKETKIAVKSDNDNFSVSETRLVENGFERRVKSNFGLLGSLVMQFGSS